MNGHTSQIDLDASDGLNGFQSNMGQHLFGSTNTFSGVQFHFHAGSEHKIDGKRHDLEMHTVHVADQTLNGIGYAAVGIMFSVEDYTAELTSPEQQIIDAFFDSLKWSDTSRDDNGEHVVAADMIVYGDLMKLVDSQNRWVYKGSVTTPPCGRFVYWNVLSTVYPISKKHLAQFKKQLNLGEDGKLDERGNFREIQKIDEHQVAYISSEVP